MIKASKNTFKEGLSKDATSLKQADSTYTDALDIRVVTDSGGTGEAVINIQGNTLMSTLPNVPSIVLATLNESQYNSTVNYPTTPWSVSVTLTINGIVLTSATSAGIEVGIDVRREEIVSLLNNDPVFAPYNLNVVSSGNRIRIWSNSAVVTNYSDSGSFFNSTTQSAILGSSQTIIGWVSSRDVFYIWTTNNVTSVGGNGTLWSMSYDHTTFATTWSLIYSSNDLLMTTVHPIANPGAIEAAYENPDYLRIAWTDFFNPLRILNAFDTELMALAPSQFELSSGGVLPNKPIFNDITTGGALYVGMHQVAARYRSSSGGYSKISPISNMVSVTEALENNSFATYDGTQLGTITNKALVFDFNGVDTSYDFLEIIHIFRNSKYASPNIAIVAELTANSVDMSFTVTGNEDRVELTLDQFLDLDIPFTHAKTIAQKDNILFAGNVYKNIPTIDFDATAIRYDINQTTNGQHPDQNVYQYQSDGVTVGGTGANISYRIISQDIDGDVRGAFNINYPHRILNNVGNATIDIGGDMHYWGDHYGYLGSPWVQSLVRSYKRGETYRFGFVPIVNGQDGRVIHIADIMIPWALSADNIFDNSFKLIRNITLNHAVLRALGIEFTVDVSSIQDQIDGWRIVRVERTEADKTILGSGLLSPMTHRFFSDKPGYYLSSVFIGRPVDNMWYHVDQNTSLPQTLYSWHCPDYLFGKPFDHRAGDELVITHAHQTIDGEAGSPALTPGGAFNIDRWKLYRHMAADHVIIPVNDAIFCSRASQTSLNNEAVYNLSVTSHNGPGLTGAGAYGDEPHSRGTDTIMVHIDAAGIQQTSHGYNNANTERYMRKFYAEYRRPNAAQYGGISASAKANNVYIDTGALQRIDQLSNPVQTIRVWGGDTFVTIWDTLKMYRNMDIATSEYPDTYGVAVYSPIESDINLDLRHGDRFNELSGTIDTTGATTLVPNDFERNGEEFFYNYAYSAENNLKVFLPTPITGEVNRDYSERIYASISKIKGELVDSWRDFRVDTMIDLEGNHGPINVLVNNSDTLFAIQDRAFGKASVNERATVSTSEGNATALGTSGVLSRFDYISTHSGSRHLFGIVKSPTSIYFFDAINGDLNRYSNGGLIPISSVRGLKAFFFDNTRGTWLFDNDNPIHYEQVNINQPGVYKGITGTYDYRYDEVLFTFHTRDKNGAYSPFTIGYDEEKNSFTSFYSFKPSLYINDKFSVISPAPISYTNSNVPGLYYHNSGVRGVFYGQAPSKSHIELLVNQGPELTKVFTNMEWNSRVLDSAGVDIPAETISNIVLSTDYQRTANSNDFTRRFRTWRHTVGRDQVVGDRIRDHHARVLMEYQNANDKKLIINDVVTIYDATTL